MVPLLIAKRASKGAKTFEACFSQLCFTINQSSYCLQAKKTEKARDTTKLTLGVNHTYQKEVTIDGCLTQAGVRAKLKQQINTRGEGSKPASLFLFP